MTVQETTHMKQDRRATIDERLTRVMASCGPWRRQ